MVGDHHKINLRAEFLNSFRYFIFIFKKRIKSKIIGLKVFASKQSNHHYAHGITPTRVSSARVFPSGLAPIGHTVPNGRVM